MKRTISGKRYNTETSRKIGEASDKAPEDPRYTHETLYRTKSGNYFIHGEGGPESRYAQERGGQWEYGEKILPLSEPMACQWLEEHLSGIELDIALSEMSMATEWVGALVTIKIKKQLDAYCKETEQNLSDVIREGIVRMMAEYSEIKKEGDKNEKE